MTTVTIATLGCKVNQFESEALMASLEEKGYCLVPFGQAADITIINTCTVTHRADFQSRQMARRALRANPGSLMIVTGCYSQVDPEALARIEGVHYLLGNREKRSIPDLLPLMQRGELPRVQVDDIQQEKRFPDVSPHTFHRHTRAFLKIQDGCNAHCSYCIVPYARGPSRSLSPQKILEHLRALNERGFKEVVLTGIHIGSYGLDLVPPFPFVELLRRLEQEATPSRIRLSSIEPLDFSEDLIALLASSAKICPHLHVPIQSGDDTVLRGMDRGYGGSLLVDLIQELHQRIPEVSIGADVIVGFPGETEENFTRSFRLIESLPLSYLHVFPFSRRKGTPAFRLPQAVNEETITRRAKGMRELGKQKRRAFHRQFLHQALSVLVEDRRDKGTGRWKGLSRNYIPVQLAEEGELHVDANQMNQELAVRITEVLENGVLGSVIGNAHGR